VLLGTSDVNGSGFPVLSRLILEGIPVRGMG
jgi:hypothetical protein